MFFIAVKQVKFKKNDTALQPIFLYLKNYIMNKLFALFVFSSLLFVSISFKKPVDAAIGNFKLKSATNQFIALSDYKTAKGFMIVFICNKCPMANLYTNRLNTLNLKYKNKGFPLLVINSMDTLVYAEESFVLMQKKAKKDNLNFPYLQDKNQTVAKQFKAENTPQAFVVWKNKSGKFIIKYQGAIDDNAGEPEKVEHHFLIDAVNKIPLCRLQQNTGSTFS